MLTLKDKRVVVAGLGHFGGQIAAARWLVEQGAKVVVTDKAPARDLAEAVEQLHGLPIEFHLGGHDTSDFTSADLIVASPAIPLSNPYLQAARGADVPITTEIRLFIERCPAAIVGVTGTKGKSTTSDILGKMLQTRYATYVGGNIGHSLLPDLGKIKAGDMVVVELSSYMLAHLGAMRWSPHVAVVSMLAADHLEWHGSLKDYLQAKANIVRFQGPDDFAVLDEENPASMDLIALTRAEVIKFGLEGRRPLEFPMPGRHNHMNAQAALAAAQALGVSWDEAQQAIRNYAPLDHRLQVVHERAGVRFVNDSIATIPEAAIAALDSYPAGSVIQIVGGYDHHLPVGPMCQALLDRAKAVLCIGQTGPALAEQLTRMAGANGNKVHHCGDLPAAVRLAKTIAQSGDVVLLSTGYKSYGVFRNFEHRGQVFAELAKET